MNGSIWDMDFEGTTTGIPWDQAGVPDGVATLDNAGKIPLSQISVVGTPVASASSISPTGDIFHVTGVTTINTITGGVSGQKIIIIPDGAFSTGLSGNIATVINAQVNTAIHLVYDGTKWYPETKIYAQQGVSITSSRAAKISDVGLVLNCNSGSAIVITINSDASVGWSGYDILTTYHNRSGVGAVSFLAGSGVTINGIPKVDALGVTQSIYRVEANTWEYI